jgi:RNA polymerase sigma-70 factor (ECF subfamily)
MTISEDRTDFGRLTGQFRHELLVYCYRMLGSVHDAEDVVQEVYLRAWRSYETFEGRSTLRTWLYRIATNACLNALRHSARRVLPSGLPAQGPQEVAWLEPIPDSMLGAEPDDPAAVVAARAEVRLAFVAAAQHLPAVQRAALILRDGMGHSAAEVADLLGTTPSAVQSALQRARSRMEKAAPASDEISEPGEPERQDLIDRYAEAFEAADITALTKLLTDDAIWEMPPNPSWFQGAAQIAGLIRTKLIHPGYARLIATRANRQPAFGLYVEDGDGHRGLGIQVVTVRDGLISHVISFHTVELFDRFGLPRRL